MKGCILCLGMGMVLGAAAACLVHKSMNSHSTAAQTAQILEEAAAALRNQ